MTIKTKSFETIHLRPHSFETTIVETTFIWDLFIQEHFIWDHVLLRPVHLRLRSHETFSFETTFIWDHSHLRPRSFETTVIWDHVHLRPHSFETTVIWDQGRNQERANCLPRNFCKHVLHMKSHFSRLRYLYVNFFSRQLHHIRAASYWIKLLTSQCAMFPKTSNT